MLIKLNHNEVNKFTGLALSVTNQIAPGPIRNYFQTSGSGFNHR